MNLTIFPLILFLKVISVRNVFIPRFFEQDSAIIVDTDKTLMKQLPYYPIYHTVGKVTPFKNEKSIAKVLPKAKEVKKSQKVKEYNYEAPYLTQVKDEFPKDLLDIAQTKLGIKHLDEIPSINELGELLGTEGVKETINYIREITATEEGIALVKAYIESLDYTDSTSITTLPSTTDYSSSTDKIASDINMTAPSLFERLSSYFNVFDFFLPNKDTDFEKTMQQYAGSTTPKSTQKPLLVRHSLPYHFPIPLRPKVVYNSRNEILHNAYHSAGHLNTPKLLRQPLRVTSKLAKKPSTSESLPQQKKLTRLAENISKFPLTYDRNALIDAQYLATIKKSIEQDEELKTIIGSAETLK